MDAQQWNERYAGEEPLFTADPSRFLGQEVAGVEPGRALDLGCGEGRNALWLAERGWHVTGVDFSDVGLAKAGRLAAARDVPAERLDLVLCDLAAYDPPPDAFDLVLLMFVHPPPPERRRLLAAAAGALVPGGTLLVVGYDVTNPTRGGAGGPRDESILFTPDDLVAEVSPPLAVERAERLRVPVPPPRGDGDDGGEAFAVDAIVRAHRPG